MTFNEAKDVVTFAAVVIGLLSGAYALYASWRKNQETAKLAAVTKASEEERKRLADRAAAIEALEVTVEAQGHVIVGLTRGLEECIVRDNAKQVEINKLRVSDYEKTRKINDLEAKVQALENK